MMDFKTFYLYLKSLTMKRFILFLILVTRGSFSSSKKEAKQYSLSNGDKVVMTFNAAFVPSPDPDITDFCRYGH